MSKPTTVFLWDTNKTNVAPGGTTSGHLTDGYPNGFVPTSQEENYWKGAVSDWLAWLNSGTLDGNYEITGNLKVDGTTELVGNATLDGNALVTGGLRVLGSAGRTSVRTFNKPSDVNCAVYTGSSFAKWRSMLSSGTSWSWESDPLDLNCWITQISAWVYDTTTTTTIELCAHWINPTAGVSDGVTTLASTTLAGIDPGNPTQIVLNTGFTSFATQYAGITGGVDEVFLRVSGGATSELIGPITYFGPRFG